LKTKKRLISILSTDQEYLGSLPDDLSARLLKLIKAGYTYEALIRRVKTNQVHIFIKEKSRGKRANSTPSFSTQPTANILKLNPSSKIKEEPINIAPTGEEDDYR